MTPTTEEKIYLHEWLWVQSLVGEISELLLVNAHRFNTVPPEDVDEKVSHLKGRLDQFMALYRNQYRENTFAFER